jgi:hypothetical protein
MNTVLQREQTPARLKGQTAKTLVTLQDDLFAFLRNKIAMGGTELSVPAGLP